MKQQDSLLLVDDDQQLLESMAAWLREQGYSVDTAQNVSAAAALYRKKNHDLVLCDVCLGEDDGFELLKQCRAISADACVILMTGYGTMDMAIEAVRAGAFDFLTKPLMDAELRMAIDRAIGQRRVIDENRQLKKQLDLRFGLESVVGRDHRMKKIFDTLEAVADTKATILITGESGTGKSLVARAIHRLSSRKDRPFVEVACGALPENLLESELFGHVAGAFTGAVGDKVGKFKQADSGTIFLDEIGTASAGMQVKLLRVLQEFEFEPVGGVKTQRVDSRVILATNEDLSKAVQEGRFRQDLFYRVNVINIELPNLRERISDIPLLANHFLERVRAEIGKAVTGFSEQALAAMQSYRWPGNVRELQNVVERAVLLGRSDTIGVDDLPKSISFPSGASLDDTPGASLKGAMAGPERQLILQALESNGWNRQLTADALGVNRTTLYKKMKRLAIDESCGLSRSAIHQLNN